jgi:arsenate reductase
MPMEKVVFACVHNAGRSQMAAAFFNAAADPSLARAVSAGTQPGARVHPEVVVAMREVGVDLSNARPKRLDDALDASVRLLVTMGCGESCPALPGIVPVDWALEDPKGKPIEKVREIRDEIARRVENLLNTHGWLRDAAG